MKNKDVNDDNKKTKKKIKLKKRKSLDESTPTKKTRK